ncbi:hybrid sensor histidine kinase/response regulator [Anaerolineales bacterium HSG24]|nr:hybrid sensor histidine kinase/response regulator [Anaerolineales bacterium HSG24]
MTIINPKEYLVLIVDDVPANLQILINRLNKFGFKTLVAQDGEHALFEAKRVKPDIILLDVVMPNMSGFEISHQLKANPTTCDIPIIFMTALNDIESKTKAFEVGGVDYVTKPFEYQEIIGRMKTHLTIRDLKREHELYNDKQNAFVSTVAQNLKIPLNSIVSYAELLRDEDNSPEEAQQFTKAIIQAGRWMNNIIEELQLLTEIQNNNTKPEPLDMTQIVTRSLERVAHLTTTYPAKIILPDNWPEVLGHASWVEEIWVNYLSNALKHGRHPRLELGATIQTDDKVCFWVQDNGPGLTPEKQAQLFAPFTHPDQIRAKETGLGLSIVQFIVQKLNEQAGVTSNVGRGSRFFFTLPALR